MSLLGQLKANETPPSNEQPQRGAPPVAAPTEEESQNWL